MKKVENGLLELTADDVHPGRVRVYVDDKIVPFPHSIDLFSGTVRRFATDSDNNPKMEGKDFIFVDVKGRSLRLEFDYGT